MPWELLQILTMVLWKATTVLFPPRDLCPTRLTLSGGKNEFPQIVQATG